MIDPAHNARKLANKRRYFFMMIDVNKKYSRKILLRV